MKKLLFIIIALLIAVSSVALGRVLTEGHQHEMTKVDEIAATCTAQGTEAHYFCSGCGKYFEDAMGETEIKAPEVIEALGHNYSDWAAAEDTDNHKKTCSSCGDEQIKAHNWVEMDRVNPTHTSDGKASYTCSACSATKEETLDKTTDHSYGAWEKADADNHKKTCECGDVHTEAHTWTETGRVDATHTAEGKVTYTCNVCSE
ncbi:MAG: hypothetical protein J6V80_04770, partial [Clostridia bacterium]|nr:hypothetical protein [Clostridia bacterium]